MTLVICTPLVSDCGVMLFSLLVTLATASNLILSNFKDHHQTFYHSSSYSDREIFINEASFYLKDGLLTIDGLDHNQYLLCFREGQLIFPNNPQDQLEKRILPVLDGDMFIYKSSDFPPNFHAMVYPQNGQERLQAANVELKFVFQFEVIDKHKTTALSKMKSRIIPCRANIYLFAFFSFILLLTAGIIVALRYSSVECGTPGAVARYLMTFERPNSTKVTYLILETKPDCDNLAFNWTRLAAPAMDCLTQAFPQVNGSDWIRIFEREYPVISRFQQTCSVEEYQ